VFRPEAFRSSARLRRAARLANFFHEFRGFPRPELFSSDMAWYVEFSLGPPSSSELLQDKSMIQQIAAAHLNGHDFNGRTRDFHGESLDVKVLDYTYERLQEGKVEEGMRALLPVLQARRLRSSEADWAHYVEVCLHHPLRALLHQDPFTGRAFNKPRGYSGDAVLLDFVYGREEGWRAPEGTSELGKKIFQFTTGSSACEAVRARRGAIADLVDALAEEVNKPDILSIASGHLREALLCSTVKRRRFGRFIALDSDEQSLEEASRCYGAFGVETCHVSIRRLFGQRQDLGLFDLVYSTGLYDYLQMPAAQRLTAALFRWLRPRGRLLIANFLPGILDVGYMESYMAWKLIYRTRQEMLAIAEEVPLADIRDIRLFAEDNQNIIFLQMTKR
jgi:extracellular factor (EF) 3-hydroxypalmitic acid methyl ester biosynthesis protein